MSQLVILSKTEQEYLLRIIESSITLRERRALFLWSQGQLQALLPHQCAGACGVHAHAHDRARKSAVPISDFSGFWGALGCSCFAF